MSRKLKLSILVVTIMLLAAVIFLAYLMYGSGPSVGAKPGANPNQNVDERKVQVLTATAVFSFWLNKKDGDLYYSNLDGQIFRQDSAGNEQAVTSQKIPNLNSVSPSADGTLAIVGAGYPQFPTFSIFNSVKRSFQVLPSGTTATAWDPQPSNKIAYFRNSGTGSMLGILDTNTGKTTDVLKINQKDMNLDWPSPDLIYLSERSASTFSASMWSYNIKTKMIKVIARQERGLSIKWWPNKNVGLKWGNQTLSLIDNDGAVITNIKLKTMPYKCWLGEPTIYCGAPSSQQSVQLSEISSALLRPDMNRLESVYRIRVGDVTEREAPVLSVLVNSGIPRTRFNVGKIEKQTDRLLILNEIDHKLYSLPL